MKSVLLLLLVVVMCGGVVGQTDTEFTPAVKILYLQNALLQHGWTYQHDVARYQNALDYKFEILTTAVVADEYDDDNSYRIVKEHIEEGFKMIFLTSSGWINVAIRLATDYPDVNFVQNPGWNFTATTGLTNLLGVDGLLYQGYYLTGLLAGQMTETRKIGMINGESVPVTVSSMNAYCLGARKSGGDDIECYSITLGNWVDERLHTQATQQLLDLGCDHVFALTGSTIPNEMVAREFEQGKRVFSTGFASDFRVRLGDTTTSSAVFNWEDVYSDAIQTQLDGDFGYGIVQRGMNSGVVDAAPPSSLVSTEAYPLFLSERDRLINAGPGEELVFCGEEALIGLPDGVFVDPDTGCLNQIDISQMTYELAYITPLEGNYFFNYVYLDSDNIAYPIMLAIISIVVILSFVYLGLIVYYMDTAVIKVASPLFCFAIILGAWMQFAAAYIYIQEPTDAHCMTPIWLEMVGLTIMLSAICVKNYRLWRMCKNSKKFFPVQISNLELLVAMVIGVLGMIAILTAFQVTDPYEPTTSRDSELDVDELYLYCDSPEEGLFIGLIWGYLAIWLVIACFLAYLTRRLEGVLCESSQLALAIYNIIVLELIFLPLIYTFDRDQYEGRTILLTLQPLYRGFSTISLIFLPKIWLAIMHPDENTISSRTNPSTHASLATYMDD